MSGPYREEGLTRVDGAEIVRLNSQVTDLETRLRRRVDRIALGTVVSFSIAGVALLSTLGAPALALSVAWVALVCGVAGVAKLASGGTTSYPGYPK